MVTFEGYERRIEKINACMKKYGIKDLEDAKAICSAKGIDVTITSTEPQPVPKDVFHSWMTRPGQKHMLPNGSMTRYQDRSRLCS